MTKKLKGKIPILKKRYTGKSDTKWDRTPTSRTLDPDTPLTDRAWVMLKSYVAMENPCIFTAYKQAGYEGRGASGATSSQEIFHQPNFQKALAEELELRRTGFRVDAAMVLRNLQLMANANLKDFGTWDNEEFVLKSSEELSRDTAYAISEIKRKANGEMTIKLESRMRANELLATHLGLLVPDPSKTKDVRQTAQEIKDAADALFNSVPTEPPTPSGSPQQESEGDD